MQSESPTQRVIQDLRVEFFKQGLTQSKIASATGWSASSVSRRINGDVSPTLDELKSLADLAGATLRVELEVAP